MAPQKVVFKKEVDKKKSAEVDEEDVLKDLYAKSIEESDPSSEETVISKRSKTDEPKKSQDLTQEQ